MTGGTLLHYLLVLTGLEQPQTQTSEAERGMLCNFLTGRRNIVEIGVFEGFTTRLLAENADPGATIYGVDPFFRGRLGISWGEKITTTYNRRHIASGRIRLIRTLSTEVAKQVPARVDFVFIDGDHSLQGITDDWAFWADRLASGGVIALHDTLLVPGKVELGSHQFFRSHIKHDVRFTIVGQQDSLSILKKN